MTTPVDCFGGIGRLYGTPAYDYFRQARVAVIGIGGVGSWVAEALARSAVGTIILMDMDDICVTNTNRQLHALHSTYGTMKVDAMADRILDICPQTEVVRMACFYTEKNAKLLWEEHPDIVVDAIDSMASKSHLIASCYHQGIPVVTCGGAGGRRDVSMIRVDDIARTEGDQLLSRLRRILKHEYGMPFHEKKRKLGIPCVFSVEKPVYPTCDGGTSCQRDPGFHGRMACDAGFGSVSHITGTFGLMAAGEALRLLEKQSRKHGSSVEEAPPSHGDPDSSDIEIPGNSNYCSKTSDGE
ncbi:tRNA threonylcarbamoyladenosine dehydratase [Akkermansia sp. N21169]|uniref:tRNA threonylcarbamoyladenosine dehydratase n=1 Tax=Akkermansia sp. N21169 TaxID=3040765 RepID=UPI00244EB1AE|nr:tRNA threonylcarbamoyladenosine dehydratase [Akkermansia sp. N21169]MDH3068348.1 tRNA threonylcarbamoyladenosine dehydratase [Akkermansia sp. N21169]